MDGNRTAYGDPEKTNNAAKRERSVAKRRKRMNDLTLTLS